MLSKGYWIQDIDVLAGGKKFSSIGDNALDIDFEINFSNSKEPDVNVVNIYNLSDSSINMIRDQAYIIVAAGYKELGNKATIGEGTIEDIEVKFSGLDKACEVKFTDGGKPWRTRELNKTYAENTKASQIMRDLAIVLGYEIVEITPKDDVVYRLGKTIKGFASKSLESLARDTKSKMFINKNRLVIRDEAMAYNTGFVLNADSGLIGSPTLNKNDSGDKTDEKKYTKDKKQNKEAKKSWHVVSLLNPRIETDSIIKVESKTLNGVYRVVSGKHTKNFNTELEVVEA